MKAELDYAMLAEHAQVQGGKLTVVGASYTFVSVPQINSPHLLSIAGRIRAPEDTEIIDLGIVIEAPNDAYKLGTGAAVAPGPDVRPYAGKIGVLFAATMIVPLTAAGLYQVTISIDGEPVRRLAFEVEIAD